MIDHFSKYVFELSITFNIYILQEISHDLGKVFLSCVSSYILSEEQSLLTKLM